jgi:aldose 1-epimerase
MKEFARIEDPASGRVMEVSTDQPGVQFYTGNFLNGVEGRDGIHYKENWGFCLETQLFPDCTNQTHFPSPVIIPGQVYTHTSCYRFSVK